VCLAALIKLAVPMNDDETPAPHPAAQMAMPGGDVTPTSPLEPAAAAPVDVEEKAPRASSDGGW
jgi:hypothetical protein